MGSLLLNIIFLFVGVAANELYHWLLNRFAKDQEKTRVNVRTLLFVAVILFSLLTAYQTNRKTERAVASAQQNAAYAKCLAQQNDRIIDAVTSNAGTSLSKFTAIREAINQVVADLGVLPPDSAKVQADLVTLNQKLDAADMARIPYGDLEGGNC